MWSTGGCGGFALKDTQTIMKRGVVEKHVEDPSFLNEKKLRQILLWCSGMQSLSSSNGHGVRVQERTVDTKRPKLTHDSLASTRFSNIVCNASYSMSPAVPAFAKQPWEQGFAGEVFKKKSPMQLETFVSSPCTIGKSDFVLGVAFIGPSASCDGIKPKLPLAVRRVKLMEWSPQEDDLRRRALGMIRIIIESNLEATRLGLLLHTMAHDLREETKIQQVLNDTFSSKSTATLYKRTISFWKFVKWRQTQGYHNALRFSEATVYMYLADLRSSGVGATSGASFLEALNFFDSLLGFVDLDIKVVVSPRVKGVAHDMKLQKAPLKQARPLTTCEVSALEQLMLETEEGHIGVICGFFLFCIATSSRFSDAQQLEGLSIDTSGQRCVVEAGVLKHKTATSAEKKTTLLPLVGFGRLLESATWAVRWLRLVVQAGLPPDRDYFLPAFNEQTHRWAKRRMSSGEGTLWLRDFLELKECELDKRPILPSSHSMKVTMLSWMVKCGNFSLEERRIAGHHLDKPGISALTYGRANFVPVMKKVHIMLVAISLGNFNPDAKTSALICEALAEEEAESEKIAEAFHAAQSEAESVSDVDDAENLEIDVKEIVPAAERRTVHLPDPKKFSMHRLSGTLHCFRDEKRFCCGRLISENYIEPESDSALGYSLCEQCRKAMPEI